MPDYRVSCGNSTTGPVGFVARLSAPSAEKALERLKEALPEWREISSDPIHLNVYFNSEALTIADVEVDE